MAKRQNIEEWESEHGIILIEGWARDGLSEEQISHNMGISQSTLKRWKKESKRIQSALKKNKAVADRIVENSLFKRANGFEYTETTEERILNPQTGQFEMVVTKKVNKVVLPDTTAQIFWLKNRKPDVWRDKREVDSTEALDKLDGILTNIRDVAKRQQNIAD